MSEAAPPVPVLVHCAWPRDRRLVGDLLQAMGAEPRSPSGPAESRQLLAGGRVGLVLADTKGGLGPLEDLLRAVDEAPDGRDLPLILLAEPDEVGAMVVLSSRRFNAVVLSKPVGVGQLQAAVGAGLRHGEGLRRNRELMHALAASNAELERRRDESEAAKQRYLDLVQGIDSIVWEADATTGRYNFMSSRVEAAFGFPCERWIDDPGFWLERVAEEDRGYARRAREAGLHEGRDFELEYRATTADGRTIWIREAARVARDDRGRPLGLRGLMWNITRRKKVERQLYKAKSDLSARLAELSYLHELSNRLTATLELEPTLEEVLAAVLGVLGAELGVLRLLEPGRGEFLTSVAVGFEGEAPADPLPPGGEAGASALARGEPFVVADAEAEPGPSLPESARLAGCRAAYVTPLVAIGGEVIGSITAYFREPHRPHEDQVRLIELYARHAADFVEHARLHHDLREADRRKDEFLAILAHELRNPLAAILGAAQVLAPNIDTGTDDASAVSESRDAILRQGRHMTRLVDDLLDASRMRNGVLPMNLVPLAVDKAVAGAVEAARPLIEARRHELKVSLPREPLWLEADPVRIEQVFVNLLTNAARYTDPGGRIELTAGREGGFLSLRVRDNGIGIAPEALPRIFGLFAQADTRADRHEGGLGIGLALVRSLAERHGGSVSASSPGPGLGSEFVVRLPLAESPEAERAPNGNGRTSPDARADAPQRRVLVVDDQADAARSLARLLKTWGNEVHIAHDGPAALEAALAHSPELVLLDIGLPGMDGHEVARRLRANPGEGPRIVALTGYGQEGDRSRSREAGFDDHLVKPVDPDDLRRIIAAG